MTSVWTYRTTVTPVAGIEGFDVEATDGHIGKIDEASDEAGESSLVVDTGFWIFGKKRVIPAGVVERIDADDGKVYVSLTKDQVKDAPDWEEDWRSDQPRRSAYDDYYLPFG